MGPDRVVRSPRLAARRRAVRAAGRRRRRRTLAALALIGGLAYGGVAMTRSQLFGLAEIEVVGARSVAERRVVEASGLRMGQNTLGIDLDAVAERVRRSIPGLRAASVERAGSLGIRIEVVERAGVIELWTPRDRTLLDERATRAVARASKRLPVLELGHAATATTLREAVGSVLRVWDGMPAWMRRRVGRFGYRAPGHITFTYGDASVLFGRAERIAQKLEALRMVRERVRRDPGRLLAVDVRAPGHPAVRIA